MMNDARKEIVDPVCGMKVDPAHADFRLTHRGKIFYFCAEHCKRAFENKPDRYAKPRGFLRRFLERLARSNEKTFGPGGPSCCH